MYVPTGTIFTFINDIATSKLCDEQKVIFLSMDTSKGYKGTLERSFERKYKIYELLVFFVWKWETMLCIKETIYILFFDKYLNSVATEYIRDYVNVEIRYILIQLN